MLNFQNLYQRAFLFTLLFSLISCKNDPLPKPISYLRLEYRKPSYKTLDSEVFYQFQYAQKARVIRKNKNWIDIKYPALKATIAMSYHPVKENLLDLLKDAEKLTFKHVIKADDIQSIPFENPKEKVYGKLFEVSGNAASQLQFHATDSLHHFVTGALYFYARPNYDSLLPAVQYLKKDIVHLMETLEWKH